MKTAIIAAGAWLIACALCAWAWSRWQRYINGREECVCAEEG